MIMQQNATMVHDRDGIVKVPTTHGYQTQKVILSLGCWPLVQTITGWKNITV